jgi:hypothetical protein
VLGKARLEDTYRPAPDRKLQIPKASGTGFRTLSIPTAIDRMVQRGIVQVLQPYLDPLFDDGSLGYRPGKDRLDALARAERLAVERGLWVWITEDVKNAFDQVPLNRLLDIVRLYIRNTEMSQLVERVIGTGSKRGLRQGGPLSPLLLNLYLHHFLDQPWRQRYADVELIRVADDLLVLCSDRQRAEQAYADLVKLLCPAAMPLKGTSQTTIRELNRGDSASWLGWRIVKRTLRKVQGNQVTELNPKQDAVPDQIPQDVQESQDQTDRQHHREQVTELGAQLQNLKLVGQECQQEERKPTELGPQFQKLKPNQLVDQDRQLQHLQPAELDLQRPEEGGQDQNLELEKESRKADPIQPRELEPSELEVHLTEKSWRQLDNKLSLLHTQPDAPLQAVAVIRGWIIQQGPCVPQLHLHDVYARISSLAIAYAFDELPSFEEVKALWSVAHALWCRRRSGRR